MKMTNCIKSLGIMVGIILLQIPIYDAWLKPVITTWGASAKEVAMPMAGDSAALTIASTRAISIHAAKHEVWQWLMQLGADRGGFYSYTFIEKAMGYETRQQDSVQAEYQDLLVGDLVRGSIHPEQSVIPYTFKVLYVEPDNALVLDKWGTFSLKAINDHQTRLVIRTQTAESADPWVKVANYIVIPLHFIMERRTLMGIKARAEAGEHVPLSDTADSVWFCAIVLSAILIGVLIFMGRGLMQSMIIPFVFSSLWMSLLFGLNPIPEYSVAFCLMVMTAMSVFVKSRKHRKPNL